MFKTTLVLIIAAMFSQLSLAGDIEMVVTGYYPANNIISESGDNWYGLYKDGDSYQLLKTSVKIIPCEKKIAPGTPFKCVSVESEESPLFLVKGIDSVKAGDIQSVEVQRGTLYPGQHRMIEKVTDDDQRHVIAAQGTATYTEEHNGKVYCRNSGNPLFSDYKILLMRDNQKYAQELISHKRMGPDRTPSVIWAGDIDGDGKLDLFMNLTWHYAMNHYALFLSSMAENGEYVKKVAELKSSGS